MGILCRLSWTHIPARASVLTSLVQAGPGHSESRDKARCTGSKSVLAVGCCLLWAWASLSNSPSSQGPSLYYSVTVYCKSCPSPWVSQKWIELFHSSSKEVIFFDGNYEEVLNCPGTATTDWFKIITGVQVAVCWPQWLAAMLCVSFVWVGMLQKRCSQYPGAPSLHPALAAQLGIPLKYSFSICGACPASPRQQIALRVA